MTADVHLAPGPSPVPPPGGGGSAVGTAARHGVLNLAGVVWAGVASFVLVVVMTRGLGLAAYGALASAIALHTLLTSAGRLGADTGLLRQVPLLRERGRERDLRALLAAGLLPVVLLGVALALATYLAADPIADVLVAGDEGRAQTAAAIRTLAPFLAVSGPMLVAAVATRGFGAAKLNALVQFFGVPTLRPLLVLLALLVAGGTVAESQAVALAWGLPLIPALAVCLVYLYRASGCRERDAALLPASPPSRVRAEFWRFARARSAAGALEAVTAWGGILLVSALRGAAEAGVYSAVTRYTTLGLFALQAIRVALGPQVSSLLARGRTSDMTSVFQAMTAWLVLLAWPFYLLVAVFAPTLLELFGPGFEAGALALVILSLCQLVAMSAGNVTLVLLMSGHSGWNLVNVLSALVLSVGLSLLLIPTYGITGAAIAWGSAVVLESLLATVEVRLLVGTGSMSASSLSAMAVALLCFGGIALAVRMVMGEGLGAVGVAVAVAGPAYLALLWRLRRTLRLDEVTRALRPQRRTKGHVA